MRLGYIISHGYAELVEIEKDESEATLLAFEPRLDCVLVIDGVVYPLCHGEAVIPKGALKKGEYHPRLESKHGVIPIAPFIKYSDGITPLDSEADVLARVLRASLDTEMRLAGAEEKIFHLTELCKGHDIFNFERKEQ